MKFLKVKLLFYFNHQKVGEKQGKSHQISTFGFSKYSETLKNN
jgi:hypothetical protein